MGLCYDTPKHDVNISAWSGGADEWKILEEQASRYNHSGRQKRFQFKDSSARDPCYE